MDTLTLLDPMQVTDDVVQIGSVIPLPDLGLLPINSFLVRGKEPLLIDTGPVPLAAETMETLNNLIDPKDLRWIWLTHTDPDHIGAVQRVLKAAPNARLVTMWFSVGKMGLHSPLPLERVHLVKPGDRVTMGDRTMIALRPPVYDAPETIALFDTKSRIFFCADTFGAVLKKMVSSADEVDDAALREGIVTWAGIDVPWLEQVDPRKMERTLRFFRRLEPSLVVGGHLQPARGEMLDRLSSHLMAALGTPSPHWAEESAELMKSAVS